MDEIKILQKRIEDLENWKRSLEASHSIPLNIHQSFTERFNNPLTAQDEKGADSETRAVDEGGVGTYNVLKNPIGFDKRVDKIAGQDKYYPWFDFT